MGSSLPIDRSKQLNQSLALDIVDWGRISYREAWDRQKQLLEKRIAGEIPDTLVFCEHDPVVTLGRASQRDGEIILPRPGLDIVEVERGGHATYHGPGQVVAYPIFQLGRNLATASEELGGAQLSRRGVLGLIRSLEAWVCDYLSEFSLAAGCVEGKTGIWVAGERKLGSIGIAAKHWVSYHGVSLNLHTGMEPWTWLNPCGLGSEVMSDLQRETGRLISYSEAVKRLSHLARLRFS